MEKAIKKMYEVECSRSNVTVREFYNYCKRQMKKKELDIENHMDFSEFVNPTQECNYDSLDETCTLKPYECHIFIKTIYNFIMKFEYDDENKGHGYMYVAEFE